MSGHIQQIFGIDFSGSQTAGDKIWIAEAASDDGTLVVKDCYPARDLPGSSRQRGACLSVLRDFIESHQNSAFGLDFPFGLPEGIRPDVSNWETFVTEFADHFDGPDDLHESCKTVGADLSGDGVEYRRQTDDDANSPWCPYNWRLRHQTYHGIADLLAPLVESGVARVRPMQDPDGSPPWVLEICPSSTLQDRGLPYRGYKDNDSEAAECRRKILQDLPVGIPKEVRQAAIADDEGDVVDSIVAAVATHNAVLHDDTVEPVSVEGHIYV